MINEEKTGVDSKLAIKVYHDKLWSYCKNLPVMKEIEKLTPQGYSYNSFLCNVKKIDEILGVDWQKDVFKAVESVRENSVLRKAKANGIGLLSLYKVYSNQVTILCQGNAVWSNQGLDFTGICKILIQNGGEDMEFDPKSPFVDERVMILQILALYLTRRLLNTSTWKNSIEKIRQQIREIEVAAQQLDFEKIEHLIGQHGSFLTEYSRYQDEYAYLERLLLQEKRMLNDHFYAEFAAPNPNMPGLKKGANHS